MSFSSSLVDFRDPLVLDASVLVNLHACGSGKRILAALPNAMVVPEIVADELKHERSRRGGEYAFLDSISAAGLIMIESLADTEDVVFRKLIASSPSIDDGEAATIAIAAYKRYLPVIDDRKGRTCAELTLEGRTPAWSLEAFRHPAVIEALGDEIAIRSLYFALRKGRMQIPHEALDEVIALIGEDRARDCTCLPKYRYRFGHSQSVDVDKDHSAHPSP